MLTRLNLATLLALAVALTPFAAIPAHAQKPALTENIDEKGRVPYHSDSSSTCGDLCDTFFKPVSAGYRLVVTHASVRYAGKSAAIAAANYACLEGGTPTAGDNTGSYEECLAPVSVGVLIGGNIPYVVSSPVTYYVEPLGQPFMLVSNTAEDFTATASISGYLVAIP
jgi:hypothetical protein